jgi:Anaphase-promoting complex, subunit 10 (APC10)
MAAQPVEKKATVIESEGDTAACMLDRTKREVGAEAVWTLSSAKSGNGVDQLRDDNINSFWQ